MEKTYEIKSGSSAIPGGRMCVCMCEPFTLSLERSREHGAVVNCADRRNIAVVKVLSPAERVSSASASPRSMVRLLPPVRDSLPSPVDRSEPPSHR